MRGIVLHQGSYKDTFQVQVPGPTHSCATMVMTPLWQNLGMALNTNFHLLLPHYLVLDSLTCATSITFGFHTSYPTHDVISLLSELTALQRLCQKIWTPMDADLLHVHLVTNKEVPNVDVPGTLAA